MCNGRTGKSSLSVLQTHSACKAMLTFMGQFPLTLLFLSGWGHSGRWSLTHCYSDWDSCALVHSKLWRYETIGINRIRLLVAYSVPLFNKRQRHHLFLKYSYMRQGLEFDCNQEVSLVHGTGSLQLKSHLRWLLVMAIFVEHRLSK